jgi:predicted phage tail protein
LADGTYDISVTATDALGNAGTDASVDELIVDTTAPVVTVTGLTTADNTPALTGTVNDPTATVQVTVNGSTYTATNNGDGTWTLADNAIAPALADGTYDVSVTATDSVGNVGTDGSIDELIVDTTAPIVTHGRCHATAHGHRVGPDRDRRGHRERHHLHGDQQRRRHLDAGR